MVQACDRMNDQLATKVGPGAQRQDAIYSDATSHQNKYYPHRFGLRGPLVGQADQLGKCWSSLQPRSFGVSDPSRILLSN